MDYVFSGVCWSYSHDIIIGAKSHFPRHDDVLLQTRGFVFYFPSGMEIVGLAGQGSFWVYTAKPIGKHRVVYHILAMR